MLECSAAHMLVVSRHCLRFVGAVAMWTAAPTNVALDLGGEALEGLGELLPPPGRRGTSVTWWERSTDPMSDPETFTEHTLDSEDGSLTSTRASTNMAATSTTSRPSQRSLRSFSMVVRGSRSPQSLLRGLAPHGYRGRSVSRSSAALRHRHPTHTPSRGPARRIPALAALTAATPPLDVRRDALLLRQRGTPHAGAHSIIE